MHESWNRTPAGAASSGAGDLLVDLGLELLEPALQALDGVHALQQKRPETVSSIGVPKKDQTKLGALDAV